MKKNIDVIVAICLVVLASTTRVFNHYNAWSNIAPVAAIGLFSGAIMGRNRLLAFAVPLAGQLLADIFFQMFTRTPGFYDLTSQVFTYGGLVAATGLGLAFRNPRPASTIAYLFGASTLFYIVSNFGYFLSGYNGYTLGGFIKTYTDAIPFFRFTVTGDLVGGTVLFGSYFAMRHLFMGRMLKATI